MSTPIEPICLGCAVRRARKEKPKACAVCPTLQEVPLYARKERAVESYFHADRADQLAANARWTEKLEKEAAAADDAWHPLKKGRPRKRKDAQRASRINGEEPRLWTAPAIE